MYISSFRVLDVVNYNWVLAKVRLRMNHGLAALIIFEGESRETQSTTIYILSEQYSPRSFLRTAPSSEKFAWRNKQGSSPMVAFVKQSFSAGHSSQIVGLLMKPTILPQYHLLPCIWATKW
ncbi:hypothetical protein FVEG_17017 [Fusarium verticillioides 7600]|uniref:Uncharacterized protein n=1 Tax=Gibberella moniliformis (strain M3125 / FGSC 7600) TaxID=334819 RepID=W7N8G5_GIBM7|nr:hypothetical protein FVEG_17017 [Fusarium verticillioides 7600]EWG52772.1 hypothetical protein FVEG_17017 [Fusarium verticillioides 7600]